MAEPISVAFSTPVIETQRLRMRGQRLDDFEALASMWANPAVVRHISKTPSTREETWAKLLRNVGHWSMLGFGYWLVEERVGNGFVGELGFANWRREIKPSLEGIPEIGWVLTPEMHGKGYASEAVQAAVEWGDIHFGSTQTACLIAPENLASIRVAEKSGYRKGLQTTYKGQSILVFFRCA